VHQAIGRHHTRDDCVGDCAGEDFICSLKFSGGVVVGSHDEAGFFVVVLVLVEDAVKVGELPGEDVAR